MHAHTHMQRSSTQCQGIISFMLRTLNRLQTCSYSSLQSMAILQRETSSLSGLCYSECCVCVFISRKCDDPLPDLCWLPIYAFISLLFFTVYRTVQTDGVEQSSHSSTGLSPLHHLTPTPCLPLQEESSIRGRASPQPRMVLTTQCSLSKVRATML